MKIFVIVLRMQIMGKPLNCRLGKHSWEGEGVTRVKTCTICGDSQNDGSKPGIRRKLLLHEIIGLIGLGVMVVGIGIFAYWNSIVEDLVNWDYEYKFLPILFIFGGVGVLCIALVVNWIEHKQGKTKFWDNDWN